LREVIRQLKAGNADIPNLYIVCGTEDFTYTLDVCSQDYLIKPGIHD